MASFMQVSQTPKKHRIEVSQVKGHIRWLGDLFWIGKHRNLKDNDLYDVLPENLSKPLGDQLEASWKRELSDAQKKNRKPSLRLAILKTFNWSFMKYGFSMFLLNIIRVLQPLILAKMMWYFDPLSKMKAEIAYMYATGLVLTTMLQTVIVRHTHLGLMEIGMRAKVACSSLIYRKVLKLSSASANQVAGGLIINLLSNDLAKFEVFTLHLHYIWVMPFVVTLVMYLIWRLLGVAAIAGIVLMTLQILPIQVYWYKITSKLRTEVAARTDKRVLLIEDMINGIRVIKMYAWEKSFEQLVYIARKCEIDAILKFYYARSVRIAPYVFTHRTAIFCTVLVSVLNGQTIAADKVFSAVHYFVLVRSLMAQYFPEAVSLGAEVNVSIKRIEKFLLLEEIQPSAKVIRSNNDDAMISIKGVKASWENNSNVNNLCDINIRVSLKKLYAVVGPVGSGKSTLLKLILGELQPHFGDVFVHGSVSYASQEPWLFSGSVRENILFGESYARDKYARVTRACSLVKDFKQLPHGDRTLVGERGTALSGGQCARVSLARAVYKDANIYLFDDPLSAVDSHVGRSLFQDCINGLLKNKTRILITHQVQYLRKVDVIILLNNGLVEFQGTFQSFSENEQYLYHLPPKNDTEKLPMEENNSDKVAKLLPISKTEKDDKKEPTENQELLAKRRVAKSIYLKYFKSGASYFTFTVLILCFVLTQLSISFFDYWLVFWTKQEEKCLQLSKNSIGVTSFINRHEYISTYAALSICGSLIVLIIVSSIIRNLLYYRTALNSSQNIHNEMVFRLLRAPLQFFIANPSGKIVDRCSKDTGAADDSLPTALLEFFDGALLSTGIIIQILIINWWTIFAMLIIAYLFVKMSNIYLSTVQDIKRIEENAKSPVFSLVNTSMLGLLTIRSCHAQKLISREFDARQNDHTAAHNLVMITSSAYGFWLDVITNSFLAFVAYSFIFLKNSQTFAGDVGLALTQILNICGMMQYVIKQISVVSTQFISVERMIQFTKLEQEGPFETEPSRMPDKSWPGQGEIRFEKLYLRYFEKDEPILKNLNLTIEPNMKVGIVGRTGAGKSSLISALIRLAKIDGSVIIDQVDTKNIGLVDLRNKISIIQQDPTLFTASLRDNLDPFHQYDNASLWSALEEVELNKLFDSLDYWIERRGGNLSAGQRQLLCLARAIIKRNKILILDEATANVDPATDVLIQKTIRSKFKDCTVLTIAHRLNTIMDSDKVLVMDDGEAVEFDQPHILLQNKNGYLFRMVQQSGNTMSRRLRMIAKQVHDANS